MRRILQQIVATCEGWEAVFFSYGDGELFREPIVCWAFISDRPYLENGEDEERYLEGQVAVHGTHLFEDGEAVSKSIPRDCAKGSGKRLVNVWFKKSY